MIITIFRSRLDEQHRAEYESVAERIHRLAAEQPGFVAIKTFAADDGERVSIVEFEDWATHNAWRDHPQHRRAQQLGRDKFYTAFSIQVAEVSRSSAK